MPVSATVRMTSSFLASALRTIFTAGESVLDGVVQKILKHFLKAACVSGDIGQGSRELQREIQAFLGRTTLCGLVAGFHQLRNADATNLQLHALGIHFRKAKQILGEAGQTAGMIQDDAEKAIAIVGIINGAGNESL